MDVGLYGKLPSHGDFLRRRTSDAFVAVWDAWLQDSLSASRAALGDAWLNLYLTSPAWRVAAGPGICGPSAFVGLVAPSVDRVGRYFPLTIVAELGADAELPRAVAATAFFDTAERLVIETLESEYVDFEGFDRDVAVLADVLARACAGGVALDQNAAAILGDGPEAAWQVPIGSAGELESALGQLATARLIALYRPLMLWWTDGSAAVPPTCLVTRGLPHPGSFAALLDGAWPRRGWKSVGGAARPPAAADDLLIAEPPISLRSAGATDTGRVRAINEDAFLERTESGLWVVADGLGGHRDGELASRMVCDALADLAAGASLEEAVADVRRRLQEVNDHLLLAASRSLLGDRSGSTVVVLLVRGRRCAVLWAGDSRAYRWREGRLQPLTRDHSPAESGPARRDGHGVTRAVGAQASLELDLHTDHVLPGDRFLLCSDGLIRCVPEDQLATALAEGDLHAVADGLIRTTLAAGAPDNVTALIVEGYEFA